MPVYVVTSASLWNSDRDTSTIEEIDLVTTDLDVAVDRFHDEAVGRDWSVSISEWVHGRKRRWIAVVDGYYSAGDG